MKMSKEYSIYLDLVRFAAAMLVVIAHYIQFNVVNSNLASVLPELGREAVIIFFVLSGYVIAYSCDLKKPTLSEYLIARAARIYSVALPVLLMSFVLAYLFMPDSDKSHYQIDKAYIYITMHSLFLGELWNIAEKPLWLSPYWSLSYEVWYYIFFSTVFFFNGIKRFFLVGLVFIFIGHKLWLLMPVWWSGVFLFWLQGRIQMHRSIALFTWLMTLIALMVFKTFDIDDYLRFLGNEIWSFDDFSLGSADRYLNDYAICVLVFLNFLSARFANFSKLISVETIIRSLSKYTYTLYLAHALVLSLWLNFYPHDNNDVMDVVGVSVAIFLSTYLLGKVTEDRKHWFKLAFENLYKSTLGRWSVDVSSPNKK